MPSPIFSCHADDISIDRTPRCAAMIRLSPSISPAQETAQPNSSTTWSTAICTAWVASLEASNLRR